jgi:MGT family glycosyltransferase
LSTYVFCVWPYTSAVNGSLKLAKTLRDRGHRVCYLGIPDGQDYIRTNGLEFIPIYEKWFPPGSLFEAESRLSRLKGVIRLLARMRHARSYLSLVQLLLSRENREFYDVLSAINPDLFFIGSGDIFPSFIAIMAYRSGVPCVYLTIDGISLPQYKVRRRRHEERAGMVSRVNRVRRKISRLLRIQVDWEAITEELARAYNVPYEMLDLNPHFPSPIKLPHLVLFPKEFELPQSQAEENCYYAEASIDLLRKEAAFPWERLNDEKSLILCSLGTMFPLGKRKTKDFFQIIIDAFTIKAKYQVVIAIGRHLRTDEFTAVPSNVIIVNQAPQLSLLKRAVMMITSAGSSTVKECIFFGVPMIVFPFQTNNQMAVASRINYHKLGLVGDLQKVSVDRIISLIDKLECDQELIGRVKKMSDTFRAIEESGVAVKYIEGDLLHTPQRLANQ